MNIIPPKGLLDGYAVGQVRSGRVLSIYPFCLDVVLEQGSGWGIYGMLPFGEAPHAEVARQYRVGQAIKVVITHLEPGERHYLWLRLADGPAEETDIIVPGAEDAEPGPPAEPAG